MRVREPGRASRPARAAIAAASMIAGLTLVACGEDDFPNNPRPPAPVELTAAIDDRSVTVAPSELGAGLVVITISNQTDEPTTFALEGPVEAVSDEIVPGGTASLKAELETGSYEAAAGSNTAIRPATIEVGPERESSQNDLLLP